MTILFLRPFLIRRDNIPKRDCGLGLKNTLNPEGTEKGDEEKNSSLTQAEGRREKELLTIQ